MYAGSDAVPTYEGGAADDALAALGNSIPGVPGEDYPIYAEVPETGFSCEGQVDGGKTLHILPSIKLKQSNALVSLCPSHCLFNSWRLFSGTCGLDFRERPSTFAI